MTPLELEIADAMNGIIEYGDHDFQIEIDRPDYSAIVVEGEFEMRGYNEYDRDCGIAYWVTDYCIVYISDIYFRGGNGKETLLTDVDHHAIEKYLRI